MQQILGVGLGPDVPQHPLEHRVGADLAFADRNHQDVAVRLGELTGDLFEQRVALRRPEPEAFLPKQGVQLFATFGHRLATPLLEKPLLDLRFRPRRPSDLQPIARWRSGLGLRRDDLDRVARLETRAQRHEAAVDLRSDTSMTDLGVHCVCEIDRRRPLGQRLDVPCRCGDEHLVLVEVHLQLIEELDRVGGELFERVQAPLPPHVGLLRLLVPPVSSNTGFGQLVHLTGADLDFEGLAVLADHRRVE